MAEWEMFAGFNDAGYSTAVGDHRYVEMHGYEPEPVMIIEDNDGEYLGWIDAGGDTPVMIQVSRIYPIQFAYGPEVEEKAGKGRTVRLRVDREEHLP